MDAAGENPAELIRCYLFNYAAVAARRITGLAGYLDTASCSRAVAKCACRRIAEAHNGRAVKLWK